MSTARTRIAGALMRGEHLVAFDHWVQPGLTSASKYACGALSQTITRDVAPMFDEGAVVSERVPGKNYHQYFIDFTKLSDRPIYKLMKDW